MTIADDIRSRLNEVVVLLSPLARSMGNLDRLETLATLRLCQHKIESSLIDLQRDVC
jgi:hypothetical protein